jgi:hypothetical protein
MSPDPVDEYLDVLEEARPRLFSRRENLVSSQLLLQAGEEALHWRIIPAVRPTAHAASDLVTGQQHLVVGAGVLAPAVRMRHQPLAGQTLGDGPFSSCVLIGIDEHHCDRGRSRREVADEKVLVEVSVQVRRPASVEDLNIVKPVSWEW